MNSRLPKYTRQSHGGRLVAKAYCYNPTMRTAQRQAKALWRRLFDEPFPKGWHISFGVAGITDVDGKEIFISALEPYDGLKAVIHEFVHTNYPKLKHNSRFANLERQLLKKAMGEQRGGR